MPSHDLNLIYNPDLNDLAHTISFQYELGYNVVALSIPVTGKLPPTAPTLPIAELSTLVPIAPSILTRLTLTISDTAQNHRVSVLQQSYDILALRPTTEKALQHCCSSLDCDLISLDLSQRLPFLLKFKTVSSALQRGIRFEICYAAGISSGTDARRNLISGAASLIRATRGRGIIISSEAKNALAVRAPGDAINLAQVWGLDAQRGKEAICEEAEKVVRLAALKRTSYRGVVNIIEGGSAVETSQTTLQQKESSKVSEKTGPNKGSSERVQTQSSLANNNVSNVAKRKASAISLSSQPMATHQEGQQPVSKREMKRRAKKARLEERQGSQPNDSSGAISQKFPIKHETLK